MEAGKLRHRIELQARAAGTQNELGEVVGGGWSTYATVHADIVTLGGRESEFARGITATATHRIEIRYLASVSTLHRVKFGDQVFSIAQAFDPERRGRMLWLVCNEVLNAEASS